MTVSHKLGLVRLHEFGSRCLGPKIIIIIIIGYLYSAVRRNITALTIYEQSKKIHFRFYITTIYLFNQKRKFLNVS